MVENQISIERVDTLSQFLDLIQECSNIILMDSDELLPLYVVKELSKENAGGTEYLKYLHSTVVVQIKLAKKIVNGGNMEKELADRGLSGDMLTVKFIELNQCLVLCEEDNKRLKRSNLSRLVKSFNPVMSSLSSVHPIFESVGEIVELYKIWMSNSRRKRKTN